MICEVRANRDMPLRPWSQELSSPATALPRQGRAGFRARGSSSAGPGKPPWPNPGCGWRAIRAEAPAAWALVLLWLLALQAHAASLTATLDRDTTYVGEPVTLSLTFEGGEPRGTPAVPEVANLRIVSAGRQSSLQIINGQTSATLTYNYQVTPTQPGDYTIPAIRAQVGTRTLATQPLKLKVLKADAAAGGGAGDPLGQFAFLKLIVPKTEVYVGEVIPIEIRLYVYDAENLQNPQLSADGFTLGHMPQGAQSRAQVGNAIYHLVSWKLSATAAKAGDLKLGPAECRLVLKVPVANRRQRDPWGFFDDDPFGFFGNRVQRVPKTLWSETHAMRVLPVPKTNAPPGFTGAVGQYTWSISVSPTNVALGDPITLKTVIAGRGSFDNLSLPPLTLRDFKVYPPTSKIETTDSLGLEGSKTFEQVVVPQSADLKEVPALAFSFFDPEKKLFTTLHQPATPLVVRPAAAAAPVPAVVAASPADPGSPPPPADIVHIKTRPGPLVALSGPLLLQPWFVALQGLPVLAFLAALVWRRRQEALANNPRLRRRRQVAHTVKAGLRELQRLAAAQRSEEFFATVFRLLQEQLGERLDLPASAITEAVIEERLKPAGAPAQTIAAVDQLFQTCNQARYAPETSTRELLSLVPKVEEALEKLQQLDVAK